MTEFYLPLIWSDPLLFNVSVLLAAFRHEQNDPTITERRSARLAKECMRLLKERILQPLNESVSDETLSAVAGLAAVEVRLKSKMLSLKANGSVEIARKGSDATCPCSHEWLTKNAGRERWNKSSKTNKSNGRDDNVLVCCHFLLFHTHTNVDTKHFPISIGRSIPRG